jgi:hypothetical protein
MKKERIMTKEEVKQAKALIDRTGYYKNTQLIPATDLPKLGDHRPIGHEGNICVSVELQPTPCGLEEYLFYRAYYANPHDYFESDMNTYYFSYMVKRDELVKYLTKEA